MTDFGPERPVALDVARELARVARDEPRTVVGSVLPQPEVEEELRVSGSGHRRFEPTDSVSAALEWATERSREGDIPVLVGSVPRVVLEEYAQLRNEVCRNRTNVKLMVVDGGLGSESSSNETPVFEDVGLLRAIPHTCVMAPADSPSAVSALGAALRHQGPVYLRLPSGSWPQVSSGTFVPGRATVVVDGADLTLLAYGPLLGQAVRAARRLHGVGIHVRVLDCASVKPIDEKAVIRAARETGALLTLEDHTPLTGLGAAVAGIAAPEVPVPIRSMGVPDLFPEPRVGEGPWDSVGLGLDSVVDQAWELLRMRGKVQ